MAYHATDSSNSSNISGGSNNCSNNIATATATATATGSVCMRGELLYFVRGEQDDPRRTQLYAP